MTPFTRNRHGSELPLISISMAVLSLLLYLCGDVASFLQYDRALIADGQFWRCITGHWTHWSFDHLLWCAITFIVLGTICERLSRKGFVISLAVSAIIIPVVSWFADQDMLFYRGLSGICSTVFVVGSILLARQALADRDWTNLILPVLAGTLFFAKIVYEFINGQALFVQSSNMFSPVPMAHLVGGVVGLLTGFFVRFQGQTKVC